MKNVHSCWLYDWLSGLVLENRVALLLMFHNHIGSAETALFPLRGHSPGLAGVMAAARADGAKMQHFLCLQPREAFSQLTLQSAKAAFSGRASSLLKTHLVTLRVDYAYKTYIYNYLAAI